MRFIVLVFSLLASTAAYSQTLPKGAVLAWVPPVEAITPDGIRPPQGWSFCKFLGDTEATDQREGRFLYGVSVAAYLKAYNAKNVVGGNIDHTHAITIGSNNKTRDDIENGDKRKVADSDHTHPATADRSSHLPPFARVLMICKQ
jgi:hypothetical protein